MSRRAGITTIWRKTRRRWSRSAGWAPSRRPHSSRDAAGRGDAPTRCCETGIPRRRSSFAQDRSAYVAQWRPIRLGGRRGAGLEVGCCRTWGGQRTRPLGRHGETSSEEEGDMVRVKMVSLSVAVLACVSLIRSVRVAPSSLASGATVEAASRVLTEALPRADGPQPVLDPSVGDGGVSAFYVWDRMVPGTPGKLLRQEPLASELMLVNAAKGLRILYSSTN